MEFRVLEPLIAAFAIVAACGSAPLQAQGYPSKPIRIVVPSLPGGAIDVTTRAIAPKLSEGLGQSIVVDNKPGADTMIGTDMVAKAAPDGLTLLTVFDNFPITQHLVDKVPYDALRDFAPVTLIIRGPMIVAVSSQLGVGKLNDLVNLSKSKSRTLSYASAGAGTSSHLTVELFKATSGVDAMAVHYKGASAAVTDLVGGHVQLMIAAFGTLLQQVKSGKVVPLAVTAPRRVPQLPDAPALAEFYPGFEAQSWVGMLAPAGTPGDIVRRVNGEVVKVLADATVKKRFEDQGYEVVGSTPEVFGRWLGEQSQKWGKVIRDRNIRLN